MKLKIELSEADVKVLVVNHLRSALGSVDLDPDDVRIMVKSKQNYRSEWEQAAFKAEYEYER